MSPKIKICKETGCVSEQTTDGFCRLHYLKNWKKIRKEKKEKSLRTLNRYIDNIIKSDPDHYVDKLKEKLNSPLEMESSGNTYFSHDEFDDVMKNLGYKEDIDRLIDSIKVDKNF
ncbi:MAG: hypothetical protein JNK65_00865 [Deltaproteobacteria bacterium]|nr:hypothetical protein [Deltaproteobacteria bacterium]